jgi:iron complex outermembrane receptor protein
MPKLLVGCRVRRCVGAFLIAGSVAAQSTAPETEPVLKLETYLVTGSMIPTAANATTAPVTVIGPQEMDGTAERTDVLELLRKAVPQFAGSGNLGGSNANVGNAITGGGSSLALRNLQTLVLLNGRRVAIDPIAAETGAIFVDVSLIPVAAIQRIEVLTDGASAIYGSDAVAGVVNVILKRDYEGAEAGAHLGVATGTGHRRERSFHVVAGANEGATSITAAAQYSKEDPLFQFQRAFSSQVFGSASFAGVISSGPNFYYLNPALNVPPPGHQPIAALVAQGVYSGPYTSTSVQQFFNLAQAVTLLQGQEKKSLMISGSRRLGGRLELFADLLGTEVKSFSQLNGSPFTASITAASPLNPTDATFTARNRLLDHPRQYYFDSRLARGVVGARGDLGGDYSWEAAVNLNRVNLHLLNPNLIDTQARIAAVASGQIDMFARLQDPAALAASGILGTADDTFTSTLDTLDVRLNGTPCTWDAGPVSFALGAETRRERLTGELDHNSLAEVGGWDAAIFGDPFDRSRRIDAFFAEVKIPLAAPAMARPLAHLLEVDVAGRTEKYSDESRSTVPKLAFRYQPWDDRLTLRGTFSKTFNAPDLASLYGPVIIGAASGLKINQVGGGVASGGVNVETGANPDLRPATADNYTFGLVSSPLSVPGLTLTADYFNIQQTGVISSIGSALIAQDVETNGPASPYASHVRLGSFTGAPVTAPGQVGVNLGNVYVTDTLVNLGAQKLSGFDFRLEEAFPGKRLGRFVVATSVALYLHYKITALVTQPAYEYAGKATFGGSSSIGTIPQWRAYTTFDYSRGPFGAFVAFTFIPSVDDLGTGGATALPPMAVSSYSSFDSHLSYNFGRSRFRDNRWLRPLELELGINNAFNRQPPLSRAFTQSNADISTYSPLGRMVYLDAACRF